MTIYLDLSLQNKNTSEMFFRSYYLLLFNFAKGNIMILDKPN